MISHAYHTTGLPPKPEGFSRAYESPKPSIPDVDKEGIIKVACNAGDPGSMPGLGRSPGEGDRLSTPVFLGFPGGSDGKESVCNAGDLGLIPGLGRSPGEGRGNPLQYSCLKNSAAVHGDAKSPPIYSIDQLPASILSP